MTEGKPKITLTIMEMERFRALKLALNHWAYETSKLKVLTKAEKALLSVANDINAGAENAKKKGQGR